VRPADVLGILLHEAAHGLAFARKVGDTSRRGRYRQPALCHPARTAPAARTKAATVGRTPIAYRHGLAHGR
jgi:hypothetical protein